MQKCNNILWKHITKENLRKACYICDVYLLKNSNYCAGHIQAKVYDGSNDLDNLKPLCRTCNGRMGTQHMMEYKQRYDQGHIPSREEFDRLKLIYKNTKLPEIESNSMDICKKRIEGFMSKFKCWPRYNDEFDPDEEIKWKNNHVLHLFYRYFLSKERDDYENYLCSEQLFDYTTYRKDLEHNLKLNSTQYQYITNLSKKFNVPIDMKVNRQPWLRQKGGNVNWRRQKSKRIMYPFVKDKVYDRTFFINTS